MEKASKTENQLLQELEAAYQRLSQLEQAEEALRESEEKYRNLIENSKDSITIVNLKGNIQFANKAAVELTGYSLDEGIGMNIKDLIPLKYLPRSLMKLKEAIKGKPVPYFEIALKRKDGTIVPVESGGQAISKDGKIVGVQIITRDITQRKKAGDALKESEEKFSKAFRSSPNSMSITTLKDGIFLNVNDSYTSFSGYTREEAIGRSVADINTWTRLEDRSRILQKLKKQGRVNNEEIEFLKKSGEIRVGLFSAEIINVGGEPCILAVTTDITERKKREQLQNDEIHVLTLLGQGAELGEVLDAIVRLGEYHDSSIKGSILLLDPLKECLVQASAPNLPDDYKELFNDGLPIGPNAGSCGTAAYLKQRVIVTDIQNDPLFKPFEEVIKRTTSNGLLACWSQPIISSNGDLLGTIANYSNKLGEPSADNLRVLEWSAQIAAIAIERKQADEKLRESEEKYRAIFEQASDSIVVIDSKTGAIVDCNDRAHENLGYSREEFAKLMVTDIDAIGSIEDVKKHIEKTHGWGTNVFETKHKTKDGEIRDVLISATTINNAGNCFDLCIWHDITERKRAEEALRESEEFSHSLLENSPNPVTVVNPDTSLKYVNPAFEKLTGFALSEIAGLKMPYPWWLEEKKGERLAGVQQGALRGNIKMEQINQTKNGEHIWVEISTTPINVDGVFKYYLSNWVDITGRKHAQEKIKQALANLGKSGAQLVATNKELESFSYSVSHDLRSPLRTIDGFSQALLEDYMDKLNERGRDYLSRVRAASQKMGELIDGLLKLSHLTRREMHREKVDLSALAGDIASRLQETQPERQTDFIIGQGLNANGDPQLLRVLLENLLGNAWKFTGKSPHARIELGTTQNGNKKAYFVRDNGAGFDMTYADKLFGAFQRLHDTTEFPGTGIGLATVQRIINRHGGSIWAEGAVGKGATFYFRLN